MHAHAASISISKIPKCGRLFIHCMQGLPAKYSSKNDEYVRAAEGGPHAQSIEEIDKLLLEAGLQLPETDIEQINGISLTVQTGHSGDDIEW